LNKILSHFLSKSFALDFEKVIALFAIPHILQRIKKATTQNNIIVKIVGSISDQNFALELSFISIIVFMSGFFNPKSFIESLFGSITTSLFIFSILFSITIETDFSSDNSPVPVYVANHLFSSIRIFLYFHSLKFFSRTFKPIFLSV